MLLSYVMFVTVVLVYINIC